jgi:catechol 2,3-dioxygenase-like lactoylglutathione lyase family enzyme
MQITALDHLVLTVADVAATCAFYQRVLGLSVVTFGQGRMALSFGQQKINLHQAGHEFEPKAARPSAGSADFCLITEQPLDKVIEKLQRENVALVLGPVPRTGAKGPMQSVYFRDPDGNLIEVARYTVEQSADRN